jgi:hypothetical protein
MNPWVNVRDRLPDPYTAVVGWSSEGDQYLIVAYSSEARCFFKQDFKNLEDGDITHWLSIPEPPKL